MEREGGSVCVGGGIEGPDGGKRGEGMGWGRRDQGRGRAKYVFVEWGGGIQVRLSDGNRGAG